MSKPTRAALFKKNGFPIQGLRRMLEYYTVNTLEDLEKMVSTGDLRPYEVYSIRGNGDKRTPGLLPQYLFNVPSYAEQRMQRVYSNLGDGI